MVINGLMVNRAGLVWRMRESLATEMPVRSWVRRTVQGRSSRNPDDLGGRYRLEVLRIRVGIADVSEHSTVDFQ